MTDRQMLLQLLEIMQVNENVDWLLSDPEEEFREIYDIIIQHLNKEGVFNEQK